MARITLEIEPELQELVQAFERLLTQVQAPVAAAPDGAPVDYGQIEQQVAQAGAELRHKALQAVLGARGVQTPRKSNP